MSSEDNGLSLQGLAQRLEALERENTELRHEVALLRGWGTHPQGGAEEEPPAAKDLDELSEPEERVVSRKRLLSRAGVAAVGLVAAGALTQRDIREAKAAIVSGTTNKANRGAVEGTNKSRQGYGVWGNSSGIGVRGTGVEAGVQGENSDRTPGIGGPGVGVFGSSLLGTGVKGIGKFPAGVDGKTTATGNSNGYGVHGEAPSTNTLGAGVHGVGGMTGVSGFSNNPDLDGAGVRGEGKYGVVGKGKGVGVRGTGVQAGVLGESDTSSGGAVEGKNNQGTGYGVWGYCPNGAGVKGDAENASRGAVEGSNEGTGYGVWGNSRGVGVKGTGNSIGLEGLGTIGYGGQFTGGKAQLWLVPGSSADAPTTGTHNMGELYMDSEGVLWICTAEGTPGTWERVNTSPD